MSIKNRTAESGINNGRITILTLLLASSVPAVALDVKIAASVNGAIITSAEAKARARLVKALAPRIKAPLPKDDELYAQTLDLMAEDLIRAQEAARYKLTVEEKEITEAIERFARFYNTTPEELKDIMAKNNVPDEALRAQM